MLQGPCHLLWWQPNEGSATFSGGMMGLDVLATERWLLAVIDWWRK